MVSRKRAENASIAGLVVQIVFAGFAFAIAAWSGSRAVGLEGWHLLGGIGIWLLTLFHIRQKRLADEEVVEAEELERARLGERIFEEGQLEAGTARSGLRVFERWFVPILTILCAGFLCFGVYNGIVKYWKPAEGVALRNSAGAAVAMVFVSFLGFLIARYTSGMAQQAEWRLLRAGSGYMMGNVLVCLTLAIALALGHFGLSRMEQVLAYAIPVFMGLIGFEYLLNLVLDIYRPRVPGQEWIPPYESRALGLFAQPQGFLKTLASTLDYQFGFKVSDTWFYQFMHRAIAPLLLIQLLILWLMTCIVVVKPGERAFIERLGTPRLSQADRALGLKATEYAPGYHLKLPWPIERARVLATTQIHILWLGLETRPKGYRDAPLLGEKSPQESEDPDVLVWDEKHVFEDRDLIAYDLLVPSVLEEKLQEFETAVPELADAPEQNMVRVHVPLFYRIRPTDDKGLDEKGNQPLYDYYYGFTDTPVLLRQIADRELLMYSASVDFLEWMSTGRLESERAMRQAIQAGADRQNLGIEILQVATAIVHPPTQAAPDFQAVSGAIEERHATVFEAEAYANRIVPKADGEAGKIVAEAMSLKAELVENSKAKAERFKKQMIAYRKSPGVYRERKYLAAVMDLLNNRRLFVVTVAANEVLQMDFTEKLTPELIDLNLMGEEQ